MVQNKEKSLVESDTHMKERKAGINLHGEYI